MADISFTAATAIRDSGDFEVGTSGASIAAGEVVYLDSATNTYKEAINTSEAAAAATGIALTTSFTGQPVVIQTSGTMTFGGTVVVGEVYMVSGTAGGIAPEADVVSADYVTLLGVGISATQVKLNVKPYAVLVP